MKENTPQREDITDIKKKIFICLNKPTNYIKFELEKKIKNAYRKLVFGNKQKLKFQYSLFYLYILSLIIPLFLQAINIKQIPNLSNKNESNVSYSEITVKISEAGYHLIISCFAFCQNNGNQEA